MPFYDFKCKKCGSKFNVMATMAEKENKLIPCPNCGDRDLERIYDTMNLSVGSAKVREQPSGCAYCAHAGGCPHAQK